jgi:hypothetical protein
LSGRSFKIKVFVGASQARIPFEFKKIKGPGSIYSRGDNLKTNFVLVDFENVQPKNVSLLHGHSFKIKVFVGANQSKISFDMARALQAYGPDAEYIQIDGNGKNALDFHISYYIGRLAAATPDASFYLISKDKGFDPLIKHLKAQGISCQRSSSIADIQGVKISSSKTISDRVDTVKPFDSRSTPEKADAVINHLARFKAAKPKTLKTLRGTINALFKSKHSECRAGRAYRAIDQSQGTKGY